MIKIRHVTKKDAKPWLKLRQELWPGASSLVLDEDIGRFLSGESQEPLAVLVAQISRQIIGFIELSIRAYAEGCDTDRIAYVEGWYVKSDLRKQGVGRQLMSAAESWAKSQGCSELGSDAGFQNDISSHVHIAMGFDEVGIIRCFRKAL